VLGVLIEILRLDGIAVERGLSRKRHIPFVFLMRVPDRPVLPLPVRRIRAARRWPSSLRPRTRVPGSIHSMISVNCASLRTRWGSFNSEVGKMGVSSLRSARQVARMTRPTPRQSDPDSQGGAARQSYSSSEKIVSTSRRSSRTRRISTALFMMR
jgi:hypothetical protein